MSASRESELVWRLRVLAALLVLAALSFAQAPGLIVPDTKLDLTENPGGFMAGALHLWDASAAFGQLQNQAYGYLFPIGPFHWVLVELGVPGWVVQRLWWSIILGVAFTGMWRLTGALRVGSEWSRFAAAFLFAVSPRLMSEVAVTSVEVWPLAMAPWVLVPLVVPELRSWLWRISWSALAVALVGGVNAVATGAVLVLPFLWLVTRRPLRRHLLVLMAWLGAVVMATLWWLGPLILLGRYSPPFLDWIENSTVTTNFASPFEALRGTTPWLNFLIESGGPSWPAGWLLVTEPVLIVITTAAAGLGLVGVARTPPPVRPFLATGLLAGLGLVTLGFVGAGGSPLAPWVREVLDGVGAPLRNTHKFEPVVRVVIAVGVAQALCDVQGLARRLRILPFAMPALVGSLLLGLAAPAVAGALPRDQGYTVIPQYWRDAAQYLDEREEPGAVLVTPGAPFADFVWGSTKDEPLQALMRRPFVVRDAVPLGSAGATRFLDSVEADLRAGSGGNGLRAALSQAGIRFVLVRHDLRPDVVDNVTVRVHEALQESGLTITQEFGPPMFNPGESPDLAVDWRTRLPFRAITVYEVPGALQAGSSPLDAAVRAESAGAEDVIDVLDAWDASAVLTGSDSKVLGERRDRAPVALVDGNRAREAFFGRSQDPYSQVLTTTDPLRTERDVTTYESDPAAPMTTRVWTGEVTDVQASSSAADANATLRRGPAAGPAAAVDGDLESSWVSGTYGSGAGEWLELFFARPVKVTGMSLVFPHPDRGSAPTDVTVETDSGSVTSAITSGGESVLSTPQGWTTRVRITADRFAPNATSAFTIAEVRIPGVAMGTALQVPGVLRSDTPALLRMTTPGAPDCAFVNGRSVCAPLLQRLPESEDGIRRVVEMDRSTPLEMSGTVIPRPGDAVEQLLDGLTPVRAAASSRAISSPAGRPAAAVDDRLDTTWLAAESDLMPWLELRFPAPVETDRAQFLVDQFAAASRAKQVEMSFDEASPVIVDVGQDGWARWSQRTFERVRITFLDTWTVRNVDAATGFESTLPVGISEIRWSGVELPPAVLQMDSPTGVPCGFGPDVYVGETRVPTRVGGTIEDIVHGRALAWESCEPVPPARGSVLIHAQSSGEFVPSELRLGDAATVSTMNPLEVSGGSPVTFRRASRSDQPRLVTLAQNYSAGWSARTDAGEVLQPVRVDGWKQGWVLPEGQTPASAEFTPDAWYRWLLLVGAVSLGAVAIAAGVSGGRPTGKHVLTSSPAHPGVLGPVTIAVAFALFGGVVGLLGGVLGLAVARWPRPREIVRSAAPVVLLTIAGLWAAVGPWPEGSAGFESAGVQLLAYWAVSVALLRR